MKNLFTTNRLITVGLTIAAIAVAMRVEPVKEVVLNEKKFLGFF